MKKTRELLNDMERYVRSGALFEQIVTMHDAICVDVSYGICAENSTNLGDGFEISNK